MGKRTQRIIILLAFTVLLIAPGGWSATASKEEITINFRDAELMAVLEFYSKLTGKIFVPAEGVTGRVNVISAGPVSEKQAIKLLFSILDMRGFAVSEVDNYYKIVPKANAMSSSTMSLQSQVAGDRLVTTMIKPKFIQASKIFESARAMISNEGKLVADANLNFLVVTDTADNIKRLRRVIAILDKPVGVPVSRTYQLQYAKVEALAPLVTALLQGGLAASGRPGAPPPTVLQDVRSNALIVSAPEQAQEQVAQVIKDLDTRSPQVLLEATIVEVTLNDSNRLGVQWQFFLNKGNESSASTSLSDAGSSSLLSDATSSLPTLQGLTFALLRPGDYAALLDLLATDTSARILSSPHLMASNNQEAALRIGDEVPVLKEFRLDQDNNPIRTFDRQKVGLEVKVTPSIAKNRDVSMKLFINISSVVAGSLTENNLFTTAEREVNTSVVVKDRQTLVISGLMRNNISDSSSGVPHLRKIPGVGNLFGTESSAGEQGELLILIRPHVITTEDEARNASDGQLRKHPAAVGAGAINQEMLEFDF